MNQRIVAIDPGTYCGMAWSDHRQPASPTNVTCLDLAPRRHEGGGMRFLRFQRALEEIAPTELYYEEVAAHKGTAAAHIYGGLVATLQTYCEHRSIPYRGVPVATIKKHATGKGGGKNANKEAMIAAALAKFGYTRGDDNEADALWLLDYALTNLAGAPVEAHAS